MTNLIDDISTLTCVSEATLSKFLPIANYSICHSIYETMRERHDVAEVDFGYGRLQIKIDDCEIRYKFIPSKELESMLIKTIRTRTSPMITKLENNLQEKIDCAYKELL